MDTRNELGHEVQCADNPARRASARDATAVGPPTSRAHAGRAKGAEPQALGVRRSPDRTRINPSTTHGLTPRMVADLALVGDGLVLARLAESVASGLLPVAAEIEPRAVVDTANPRSPVEEMVLRSMVLAAGQQRHLLHLAAEARAPEVRMRYADLALRASREVARGAAAWNALRRPPSVVVESGAQANVVGGDQVIHQGIHGHEAASNGRG